MRQSFGFREWEHELSRLPRERFTGLMKPNVLAVAMIVRRHAHGDGTNSHPGIARLTEESGLSRNTVRRSLDWLVDNRWLRRRGRAGRQADEYDLLPAEIPLANGPVDLAEIPDDGADETLASLADLWTDDPPEGPASGSTLRVNGGGRSGSDLTRKPPLVGQPERRSGSTIDPHLETTSDAYTGFSKEKPPGARPPAPTREGGPTPPDGLSWSGQRDRFGTPRWTDRFGNAIATDAEIRAAYERSSGPDPRQAAAADRVRDVRRDLGWKPGPSASGPPSPPPWTDPEWDPFTVERDPSSVQWLDDRESNSVPEANGKRREEGSTRNTRESPDAVGNAIRGTDAQRASGTDQ